MTQVTSPAMQRLGVTGRIAVVTLCWLIATLGTGSLVAAAQAADPVGDCNVRSGASTPTVIELYTSEGCSSCPPADRWLSKWTSQPDVIALAFHVDYWDNLGWKDPFGSPAHTERQYQQQAVNGSRFSYTPQVTINGADSRQWQSLRPPIAVSAAASLLQVQLSRDGGRYIAQVRHAAGAPERLAAYWAVTENRHVSAVKSGENRGETLTHDFVVREYRLVPVWTTGTETARTLTFSPALATRSADHLRHVNLVIVDAASGRPVQAVRLGC
ncbi:MAG: DUF1223 domain-containing protein [Burkholderiaceae bacterium]|nr:DUF1223 domain-containing protein [Burkholderiaceae bacterium]